MAKLELPYSAVKQMDVRIVKLQKRIAVLTKRLQTVKASRAKVTALPKDKRGAPKKVKRKKK